MLRPLIREGLEGTGGDCMQLNPEMNRMASPLLPACRLSADQLPRVLAGNITALQRNGLAFGVRDMTIKSATVQSFALGSNTSGAAKFGGVGRAIGPWAVFGGMASLQQHSANIFRTDVQMKLEDASGCKTFLNYSLPFAITLAVDPGET